MNLLLCLWGLELWLGFMPRIVLWPSCTFHVGWALVGNSTPVTASCNTTAAEPDLRITKGFEERTSCQQAVPTTPEKYPRACDPSSQLMHSLMFASTTAKVRMKNRQRARYLGVQENGNLPQCFWAPVQIMRMVSPPSYHEGPASLAPIETTHWRPD